MLDMRHGLKQRVIDEAFDRSSVARHRWRTTDESSTSLCMYLCNWTTLLSFSFCLFHNIHPQWFCLFCENY